MGIERRAQLDSSVSAEMVRRVARPKRMNDTLHVRVSTTFFIKGHMLSDRFTGSRVVLKDSDTTRVKYGLSVSMSVIAHSFE